jgi:hypothetical protein
MDDVKAARERLEDAARDCGWGYAPDVRTLLSDHARLTAEVERLSAPVVVESTEAEISMPPDFLSRIKAVRATFGGERCGLRMCLDALKANEWDIDKAKKALCEQHGWTLPEEVPNA